MPEITVVITSYNLESYIAGCLDELFGQSFQDFNILIVDDCSKDRTVLMIRDYQSNFPGRLRLIEREKNLGSPARTRNAAMDSGFIDGRFVIFLDGDDHLEPDFLEKLHTAALRTNADITLCGYDRIDEETGRVLCTEMTSFPILLHLPPQDDSLCFINGSLWNKLIRTDLIGNTRIPDFKVGEDVSFLQALYAKAVSVAGVQDVLIHYGVRGGSVISNTQPETIRAFADELAQLYQAQREPVLRENLALLAFIHLGISMAARAYDNPSVQIGEHLRWTRRYLYTQFDGLRTCRFLRLPSLVRHGVKGYALYICKLLYKFHCFSLFLFLYRFVRRLLHVDFKF